MPPFQVLVLILFCFQLKFCICTDTILSTQSISDSDIIVSSNGNFKLGFFSPVHCTSRYIGIFFNIPILIPVWVANRDKPLNNSLGSLTISEDGNLVILDGQKTVIWSSNVRNSMANSTVRLLDTGNLVLQGSDFNGTTTLWESFQHPTDSYLPKMMLSTDIRDNRKIMLTSWRSPSDPSIGRFSAGLDPLNIPEFFVWNGSRPIWRSGPWNGQIFTGVPTMSGLYGNGFSIVDDKEGNASLTSRYPFQSRYLYMMLSSEGILSFRYWDKDLQHWVDYGTNNYCDAYNRCGRYGICDSWSSPICSCLNGFKPMNVEEWSKGNWTSGCVRRTKLKCERNNTDENTREDGFLKYPKVKVPDFAEWSAVTDSCKSECLNNCSCVAYAYTSGIGCMHWAGSLIDIMQLSDNGVVDLYVRVAYSEFGKKKSMNVVVIVIPIVVLISIAISACFAWRRGKNKKGVVLRTTQNRVKLEDLPIYNFGKLAAATRNFQSENKLGEGGFGPVYKGMLADGQEIAVKRLSRSSGQGLEEFMNEVVVISKLQHRNLVRLLGCCIERGEKMLVYEYMPNGGLDSLLFDQERQKYLDWDKRVNIIQGIARGLLYLHRDSRLKIIHRDLKASNILLDQNLIPKISDFGMAKIFGGEKDQENTGRVVGTYGYMAPEYAMEGRFSEKSDVYSFGVLLLEIVSGRKNSSFYNKEHPWSLSRLAWKLWNEEKILELADRTICDPSNEREILRCVHVGLLCVQEFAEDRPTVSTVLSMLTSETADIPTPKEPAFAERHTSSENHASPMVKQVFSVNKASITLLEGR